MTVTDKPTVTPEADGTVTIREMSDQGIVITYKYIHPGDAYDYLVDHGIADVELPLSSTDHDLDELVKIMDEFKALQEDVMAENRNERLFILWERFTTYNTARKIAEAEFIPDIDNEGGTS